MKTLSELLIIAIGSAIVNNVVSASFLEFVHSLEYPKKLRQLQVWEERLCLLLHFLPC